MQVSSMILKILNDTILTAKYLDYNLFNISNVEKPIPEIETISVCIMNNLGYPIMYNKLILVLLMIIIIILY